jgi:hypothetical protein
MFSILAFLCLIQAFPAAQDSAKPLPNLDEFLKGVRAHLHSDRLLLSQYTYTQKQTEHQFDKKGKLRKTIVRVFEVYPSLEEGFTYMRLISRDGKPLSSAELEKQDRAHDKKVREHARKLEREGTDEKTRRLAKEAEERRKEDKDIDELFQLYQISMVGRENLDGHSAIQLTFQPRTNYKPKTTEAKIMMKVAGKAWIGEEDYELLRLQFELIDTISIGLGMLIRLNKGTSATFQRRRVNNEIWLPAESRFAGSARILLVKGLRTESISEFSDYRKFSVSSTVTFSNR